jgi:hypothetical protein
MVGVAVMGRPTTKPGRRSCVLALALITLACTAPPAQPKSDESPVVPPRPRPSPRQPTAIEVELETMGDAPPLSREDDIRLTSLISRGREAVGNGQLNRALQLFEQGLGLDRRPQLLCEAGWVAFRAKDPRAEGLLREGVELLHPSDWFRAHCLYHLGRVLEHDGRHIEAADAYSHSLALRPDHPDTQRRYVALTDTDYSTALDECPPSGRFQDVEAFCGALAAAYARDYDRPDLEPRDPDSMPQRCGLASSKFDVEGPGLGELVVVEQPHPAGLLYETSYLLLQRDGVLEPLGRIWTSADLHCSIGGVEIERARWSSDGPVRLIVELHAAIKYGCLTSPWDKCMDKKANLAYEASSFCTGESRVPATEVVDKRYRMICAELDGQLRCSVPPEFPRTATAAAARFDPLPRGDRLMAKLRCPTGSLATQP